MHSDKIIGALLKFCFAVLFLKYVVFGSWMKSPIHKGPGYSVLKPVGWEVITEDTGVQPFFAANEKPNVVQFATPEKILGTDVPQASIAILVVKLANPTWIDEEFPSLLEALKKVDCFIFDHGQIKIDEQIFYWVFYREPTDTVVSLEFYYVNDLNKLYKIQYQAATPLFKDYRPVFESTKDTFKFSQQLW